MCVCFWGRVCVGGAVFVCLVWAGSLYGEGAVTLLPGNKPQIDKGRAISDDFSQKSIQRG